MAKPTGSREELFWKMFQEAPSGVALLDLAGHIDACNPALQEMLHGGKDELGANWLVDLVHPVYRDDVSRITEEVLSGQRTDGGIEAGLLGLGASLTWSRISLFLARTRQGEPDYGLAIFEPTKSEKKVLDAIHLLATTDDLTGLLNRRGFLLLAEQEWRVALRKSRELAILYLDLDGLKSINDSLGHKAGDDAIRQTAEILRTTCRDTDIVARLGGDEFAILMVEPGRTGVDLFRRRILEALAAYNRETKRKFALAASIGAAYLAAGEATPIEDLLAMADRKMYVEKKGKRA